MNRIKISKSSLPITLIEASVTNEEEEKLFVIPKILIFRSEKTISIGNIGSRNSKTVNVESNVGGYIPSVYGIKAPELHLCVQQLLINRKEINIAGYLKNGARGQLKGVLIESLSYLNDENGPHTGWIKVVAKGYKVEPVKDKNK